MSPLARSLSLLLAAVASLATACTGREEGDDDPIDEPDAGHDSGPEGPNPEEHSGEVIFDQSVLHEIVIEVDPSNIDALESDHENRISCTFTFDGVTLHDVGIRQKGQGTSAGSLGTKPSFSVKFDEFVEGQELDGVDKLVFQNASYDATLMNESLGYELYRLAGIPAPRTSHGVIRLVGMPGGDRVYGVHVIVEGVNKNFLRRNFGKNNDEGNLYEDDARGDFAANWSTISLKDEEEGRTREHLAELADILTNAPADQLVAQLMPILDIEVATTGWAIDILTGNWDGFWTASHNYYIYDNPADGRFVLMPHGMDLLFGGIDWGSACLDFGGASSMLGRRFLEVPAMTEMAGRARAHVLADLWVPEELNAKVQNLTALLDSSAHDEPAFVADAAGHRRTATRLMQTIVAFDQDALDAPAACGNGVLERAEVCARQCDDGNVDSGDGCSPACVMEICGDGVVQPGLGEVCENNEPSCNPTCTGYIVCGDGRVEAAETCDDGNTEPGDGCTEDCQPEFCGDGVPQPGLGEVCDGDRLCRADCSGIIPCGDGVTEFPEYCDDGNQINDDGCTNECEAYCVPLVHGAQTFDLCLSEVNFELAGPICAHLGSLPAPPRNLDEQEWLYTETQRVAPGDWWLGVVGVGNNQWRKAGGGVLPAYLWAPGEPRGEGDCVVLTDEGWSDTACDEAHPVVCVR